MRKHINNNLVFTTSQSETKKDFAKRNRESNVKFIASVFGKKKPISKADYERLKAAGFKVDMIVE